MLKKLTVLSAAAIFTLSMGMAQATPATQTGPVELTSAEMDDVNAGGKRHRRNRHNRVRGTRATGYAVATANGPGAQASTSTITYTDRNFADSESISVSRTGGSYKPRKHYKNW